MTDGERESVPPSDDVSLFEAYKAAVMHPELAEPRRVVCRILSSQLAACGEQLWAFGLGGRSFRTVLSMVIQFGGSLSGGAATLAEQTNWYAASALVRQFIEVEYLIRLFRRDPNEALTWLGASSSDLCAVFSPSKMRKRMGNGEFRHEEYAAHCDLGGHPNPKAHFLLPDRHFEQHQPPFGSNDIVWIDLAQHLRRIWMDIEAIPADHPKEDLNVILQYIGAVRDAVRAWEEVDPCSVMIPEEWQAELVAGAESVRQAPPSGAG